jgi:hypothetical protein
MRIATLTALALTAVMVLGAAGTAAAAPDPTFSSCEWSFFLCDGEGDKILACPAGDGAHIFVRVYDEFGDPYANAEVYASFTSTCQFCQCPPIPAITDAFGVALVNVYVGLARAIQEDCCVVTTTVTCEGVTIPWVYGGDTDSREWLSPDLNADCIVDDADQTIFMNRMGGTACANDYNCDGWIDVADAAWFTPHYLHACPASPVEQSTWGVIKALFRP